MLGNDLETGAGASGWCFAFDVATNKVTTMLALTAGEGAGIWMAGRVVGRSARFPICDDRKRRFRRRQPMGKSVLKLQYTPPSGDTAATLKVVDHWTPWTDFARTGQKVASTTPRPSGASAVSEALMQPVGGRMNFALKDARLVANINDRGKPTVLVFPQMAHGAWSDQDLASAGPACIFAIGVCISAGKEGIAYPVKMAQMGGTTPADLENPKANCAKLAAPPVWLTMSPGPVDPCPADPDLELPPRRRYGAPPYDPRAVLRPRAELMGDLRVGQNSQLHKWKVSSTGALTYVAQSHEFASDNVRETPPGGMPGGFCSGSSNGADPTRHFFCTIPYGDANTNVVNGRFLVYDPVHLAADGSLKVLRDSQQFAVQFLFNKFDPPVVNGGQIYVPNYNGGVDLYRLMQ